MLRKRLWTALLALMAVVGMAGGALAAAIDVSTETDLKNALDGTYDTINVTADIALSGTLNITRSVTLDGNGHTLSLNMGNFGSVVKVTRPDENSPITVNMVRFTITGGRTTNDDCGGMYVGDGVTATVTNCIFSGNKSSGYGGGMRVDGNATVTDCTFSDNMGSFCGGGMYVYSNATATVTDCTFSGNTGGSGSGGGGGGMCVQYTDDSTVTVTNCTFSDNSTSDDGGGMLIDGSNVTVVNCIFTDNNASYDGGGMSFRSAQNNVTVNVSNCTFSGNSASGPSAQGGGMGASSNGGDTTINMANCTFIGNSASYDGGGMYIGAGVTTTNVTNCTFANNSTSSNGGGLYAGDRTIAAVTNCTFADNNATNGGHEIYVDNGIGLFNAVNTLFWNSGQYIVNKGNMSFYNCAYASGAISGTLSNTSTNNVDTLDWSGRIAIGVMAKDMKHTVLPLRARDEALRNKGASSIAGNATLTALIPQDDQLGNLRSGNPDIGAMEYGSIPFLDVELLGDKTLVVIYGEGGTLKLETIVSRDYNEVKTLNPSEYELVWSTTSEDLSNFDLDFSGGTLTVGTKTEVGTYNIPIVVNASSAEETGAVGATITVTVNKATPKISPTPTASAITYGQTLADSTLTGEASVPGTFAWADSTIKPTVADSGKSYAVLFTPRDTHNYNIASSVVPVTVNKANSRVVTAPAAKTGLIANGTVQELITAGKAEGGMMVYALNGGVYSTDIPVGTNAGSYTVSYKVVGDTNHSDTTEVTLPNVTIAPEEQKAVEEQADKLIEGMDSATKNSEAGQAITNALQSSNPEEKAAAVDVMNSFEKTGTDISNLSANDITSAVKNKEEENKAKKAEKESQEVADTKVPVATDLLADSSNTDLKDASKELSVQPKVVEPEVNVESKDEIASTLGVTIETNITIDSADKELSKQTEAVEALFNAISADLASADNSAGGKGVVIVTVFPRMRPYATGFFPLKVNLRNLMPGRRLKFWPSVSYFQQKASGKVALAGVSLAAGAEGDFYFLDESGNEVKKVTGDASKMTMVPFLTVGKEYSDAFITADATEKDQEQLQKLAENAGSGSGNPNAPTSDKDGGGCEMGLSGLALMTLIPLCARKQK